MITDVDYTDPITDNMAVEKTVVFGPFLAIFYNFTYPTSGQSFPLTEAPAGGTLTEFTVSLDTLPTADVVIPIQLTDINGTANSSRLVADVLNAVGVPISQTEVRFTPQNGRIPQRIRVSAKSNAIRESDVTHLVRFRPATGTDTRFTRDPQDVAFTVTDTTNSPVQITASKTTITLAENATTTFTLTPSAAVRQTSATLGLEIVDGNGDVVPLAQATVTATVTFSASSLTAQTVTVRSLNDNLQNGTRNWTVRLKPVVSTDVSFSGVDVADIPLTVTDDELP